MLTDAQRSELFLLLNRYFDGVTREQFEADLAEKNWLLEIRRGARLLGFSTLLVEEMEFQGRMMTALFSGDTIVSPEAWGSPLLARTWIAAVNHLRAANPARPCYWLLITSGFRTYRFLPVFWREYYPRHDVIMPRDIRHLRDHLASARYGDRFDPRTGLVRFARPQTLRGALKDVPSGRTVDPDVAFFM
jgi:hypothetical protein